MSEQLPPDYGANSENLPEVLYKFRSWEDKFHRQIINDSLAFFTSPLRFNDPFDCAIPVHFGKLSSHEILQDINEHLKQHQPHLKRSERRAKARELKKQKHYKNMELQTQLQREIRASAFGIFSLTSNPNNIVMWSHYADSHKGFCIGFDIQKLLKTALGLTTYGGRTLPVLLELHKINYMETFPYMDRQRLSTWKRMIIPVTTKSTDWSYEEEYRVLAYGAPDRAAAIPKGTIVKLILGCETPKEQKAELIDIVADKHSNIDLYQAKKKTDAFGVVFEQIDY